MDPVHRLAAKCLAIEPSFKLEQVTDDKEGVIYRASFKRRGQVYELSEVAAPKVMSAERQQLQMLGVCLRQLQGK